MTILESMGHGIPNISTNIAAIPEAISDGINGYLITPGDINSLKEKMKNVILNRKIREKFSESAYETAKKEFSIDSHINRLLKIYKDILDDWVQLELSTAYEWRNKNENYGKTFDKYCGASL